jgi:hypothetical protein
MPCRGADGGIDGHVAGSSLEGAVLLGCIRHAGRLEMNSAVFASLAWFAMAAS